MKEQDLITSTVEDEVCLYLNNISGPIDGFKLINGTHKKGCIRDEAGALLLKLTDYDDTESLYYMDPTKKLFSIGGKLPKIRDDHSTSIRSYKGPLGDDVISELRKDIFHILVFTKNNKAPISTLKVYGYIKGILNITSGLNSLDEDGKFPALSLGCDLINTGLGSINLKSKNPILSDKTQYPDDLGIFPYKINSKGDINIYPSAYLNDLKLKGKNITIQDSFDVIGDISITSNKLICNGYPEIYTTGDVELKFNARAIYNDTGDESFIIIYIPEDKSLVVNGNVVQLNQLVDGIYRSTPLPEDERIDHITFKDFIQPVSQEEWYSKDNREFFDKLKCDWMEWSNSHQSEIYLWNCYSAITYLKSTRDYTELPTEITLRRYPDLQQGMWENMNKSDVCGTIVLGVNWEESARNELQAQLKKNLESHTGVDIIPPYATVSMDTPLWFNGLQAVEKIAWHEGYAANGRRFTNLRCKYPNNSHSEGQESQLSRILYSWIATSSGDLAVALELIYPIGEYLGILGTIIPYDARDMNIQVIENLLQLYIDMVRAIDAGEWIYE